MNIFYVLKTYDTKKSDFGENQMIIVETSNKALFLFFITIYIQVYRIQLTVLTVNRLILRVTY